ncbi:MAG: SET domain-containing protein-lysine N-methyltransferase [Pseudomonadota bacterium]
MDRIYSPDVYVADTLTGKGRGVFAGRDYRAGEVVEVSPAIVLEKEAVALLRDTLLRTYDFDWQVLANTNTPATAIAAGYGGMYNHSDPANMRYHADPLAVTLIFTAVRDIRRDEQLTINYNARGGGHVWHDDNWFEREDIKLTGD